MIFPIGNYEVAASMNDSSNLSTFMVVVNHGVDLKPQWRTTKSTASFLGV